MAQEWTQQDGVLRNKTRETPKLCFVMRNAETSLHSLDLHREYYSWLTGKRKQKKKTKNEQQTETYRRPVTILDIRANLAGWWKVVGRHLVGFFCFREENRKEQINSPQTIFHGLLITKFSTVQINSQEFS